MRSPRSLEPGIRGHLVPAATSGDVAFAAVLALGLTVGLHLTLGRYGLDLAEEGFLLYGVRRTLAGEVPLRDFQSYEPGRYYWCAAWCAARGQGFLALRGALAAFQAVGLFCGLLVARRAVADRRLLLPIGIVLLAWMFPRHKAFDSSIAMMAVLAGLLLVERPTLRRHFLVGGFTGLAAFFGRNHGLYCALGTGALVLALARPGREGVQASLFRRASAWFLGIVAGSSPLLGMIALVPGFGRSFVDSLLFFVEQGANLPLPYPWPWRFGYEHLGTLERIAVASAFLLPVLVYPVGIAVGIFAPAWNSGRRAALIAASFVGAAYAHQAAVRSDAAHLAQSIAPALLAALALPRAFGFERKTIPAWSLLGFVVVLTALATAATNPVVGILRRGRDAPPLVRRTIGDDELRLEPQLAANLDEVQRVFAAHVPSGERYVFMAPTFSALYPIQDKLSPVWRIYFLWPGSAEEQARIIRDLEARRVRFAFIVETTIDGRREFMFRNSHPAVWRHLLERFERVPTPNLPANHHLLRRRANL